MTEVVVIRSPRGGTNTLSLSLAAVRDCFLTQPETTYPTAIKLKVCEHVLLCAVSCMDTSPSF